MSATPRRSATEVPVSIDGVLETCLYARDLEAAERFYASVLELTVVAHVAERHVFFRCGAAMLLVFDPARTASAPGEVGGTPVPAHGAHGAGHVCFRVAADELGAWRARLERAGVAIEAEIVWPRGGSSLYVRDPAGNSVELAPASIWSIRD
jgi:catechol 2,3-dioxygenase-like lactoylglutathione lyase family enzyme